MTTTLKPDTAVRGALELKSLVKRYDGADENAVDGIDLDILPGEFITLLGPSGCGKTTTLRMIAGFEEPTAGSIDLDGADLVRMRPNKRPIAMVFQNYALFPHMTVAQNVGYGLRMQKWKPSAINEAVEVALASMNLTGMQDRSPHQLSGGQQQRVALARAMVLRPSLMLFDEPLSNLDAKLRDHMRTEIRQLQQRLGITSIYVTHDQAEAMSLSDRIVVMSKGRIEQLDTPAEVYNSPATSFMADFIGRASFLRTPVLGEEGDLRRVKAFGREYLVRSHPDVGRDGLLVLRPEGVAVEASESEADGTVVSAMYFGPNVEYEVDTAEGKILVSVANPDPRDLLEVATRVKLSLTNNKAYLLPDQPVSAS